MVARSWVRTFCTLCTFVLCLVAPGASVRAERPFVYVTNINRDVVTVVLYEWIEDCIAKAEEDGAAALVIELDTPGGTLPSTHDIVKTIMSSPVPVIVYVAPSGSTATSAGTFITISAHIAAMAPGTSIGAAHVVMSDGSFPTDNPEKDRDTEEPEKDTTKDAEPERTIPDRIADSIADRVIKKLEDRGAVEPEEKQAPETTDSGEAEGKPADEAAPAVTDENQQPPSERKQQSTGVAMADKIMNDTVAWARTIAETRGRNADWVEDAIVKSESLTEDEALAKNVIDYVAPSVPDLLRQADGREVDLDGTTVTLNVKDAEIRRLDMTARYRILGVLAHPQLLLLLFSLGGIGLTVELYHPNGITGTVGVICLILAFFGMQVLPVNYAGVALIAIAFLMIVAEIKIVSYGLLTLGAMVCFTLGGLMLIDSPNELLRIHLKDVLPVSLALGMIAGFLVTLLVRSVRERPMTGEQGMVGAVGVVRKALDPRGQVETRGELWSAVSETPIPVGTEVRVVSTEGLTLHVQPMGGEAPRAGAPEASQSAAVTTEEGPS